MADEKNGAQASDANKATPAVAKFKRSKDRSHIINFAWIFNKDCDLLANYMKYSAGTNYKLEALEERHVPHVLIGYYVRRAMNLFVGQRGKCAVRIPLCKDFGRRMQFVNTERFLLYLPKLQEVSPSILSVFNQMSKMHMSIAIDVYSLIYTRWAEMVKEFTYAVIEMDQDPDEQFYLLNNIKNVAPNIKSIAKCRDIAQCRAAFAKGVDYCCCHEIPPEICIKCMNKAYSDTCLDIFSDVCSVLIEHFQDSFNSSSFKNFLNKYYRILPYIKPVIDYVAADTPYAIDVRDISTYDEANVILPPELIKKIQLMICIQLLSFRFLSNEQRKLGRNEYMPTKMALLEGKIWEKMLENEDVSEDLPIFTMGVTLNLKRFVTSGTELRDLNYEELIEKTTNHILNNPSIKSIYLACDALRKDDLSRVEQIGEEAGFFNGTQLSSSLESGILWIEAFYKELENKLPLANPQMT